MVPAHRQAGFAGVAAHFPVCGWDFIKVVLRVVRRALEHFEQSRGWVEPSRPGDPSYVA